MLGWLMTLPVRSCWLQIKSERKGKLGVGWFKVFFVFAGRLRRV